MSLGAPGDAWAPPSGVVSQLVTTCTTEGSRPESTWSVPIPNRAVTTISTRPLIASEAGARITSATPIKPRSFATIRCAASGSPRIRSTRMLRVYGQFVPSESPKPKPSTKLPSRLRTRGERRFRQVHAADHGSLARRRGREAARDARADGGHDENGDQEPDQPNRGRDLALHHGRGGCQAGIGLRRSSSLRRVPWERSEASRGSACRRARSGRGRSSRCRRSPSRPRR